MHILYPAPIIVDAQPEGNVYGEYRKERIK